MSNNSKKKWYKIRLKTIAKNNNVVGCDKDIKLPLTYKVKLIKRLPIFGYFHHMVSLEK